MAGDGAGVTSPPWCRAPGRARRSTGSARIRGSGSPAGQPAQHPEHRRPHAAQRQPTPCRAASATSRPGPRTAPGRGCRAAAPPGSRSAIGHRDQPGHAGCRRWCPAPACRRAAAPGRPRRPRPRRSGTCSRISPADDHVGHAVARAAAAARRRGPAGRRARRPAGARPGPGRRRRAGSPSRAACGASSPAPQPRSTSSAPGRGAGGSSSARAAAIQRSIANAPYGRHHSSAMSSYCRGSLRGSRSAADVRPGDMRPL